MTFYLIDVSLWERGFCLYWPSSACSPYSLSTVLHPACPYWTASLSPWASSASGAYGRRWEGERRVRLRCLSFWLLPGRAPVSWLPHWRCLLTVTGAVREFPPHSFGLRKHLPSLVHSNLALLFTARFRAISLGFPVPCPRQLNSSFIKLSSYYPIRTCHLVPTRPLPNSVPFISVSPGFRTAPFTPRALNKFRN